MQVAFSMSVENVKFMDECSPKHVHMGTVRLK